MNMPTRVRIGPVTYTVRLCPPNPMLKDPESASFGQCDHTRLEIRIDAALVDGARREVLMHELLHAIAMVSRGGLDGLDGDEKEEQVVTAYSPWLLLVLRDNPRVLSYLMERA